LEEDDVSSPVGFVTLRGPENSGRDKRSLSPARHSQTNVRDVGWTDRLGLARFHPDEIPIYHGEILLHSSLMDKLDSNDLKPLIASTLLHRESINSEAIRGMLKFLAPAFLAMYVEVYIVQHVFSDNSIASRIAIGTSVLLGLGIVFFAFTRLSKIFTRVWFDADRRTAKLLGAEAFLSVLEKMDAMGLGRGRRFREQPSVQDRIANLRKIDIGLRSVGS